MFKEYFVRTKRLNSKPDLLNTSLQFVAAGIEVEDSIWGHFANQDKYLIKLYTSLKEIGKEDLIPDSCLTQEKVARGLLYRYVTIEDEDSVQFLKRVPASTKDTKGYIYIFKKKDKYNEAEWNYDYVGVLPLDSTIIPDQTDVRNTGNDYLDDEDLDEKMKYAVADLLYTERNRVKKKNPTLQTITGIRDDRFNFNLFAGKFFYDLAKEYGKKQSWICHYWRCIVLWRSVSSWNAHLCPY